MPEIPDTLKARIGDRLEVFVNELEDTEREEILRRKEEILTKLMVGKFKDLGGLTAMRGFVYQYYVAMYYMVSMICPTRETWWDAVILEYFDDVTLIGKEKIRFIQVKTIKEDGIKNHKPNNFYTRKQLTVVDDNRKHFNSWVEKNILNYDFFLESTINQDGDMDSYIPQFEIVTNTLKSSLTKLEKYTDNFDFEILDTLNEEQETVEAIGNEDVLKKEIQKPINILGYKFEEYSKEDLDYYLKKLYINKLGVTSELRLDIVNMLEEYVAITDIRSESITQHIFEKMFEFVISNSHEDTEYKIEKNRLIITDVEIKVLVEEWLVEAKELISEKAYYDSAWGVFKEVLSELESEFREQFSNIHLKEEMLNQLRWLNVHITSNNKDDSTYCVTILNQIFNANNNVSMWNYDNSDTKGHLKDSLRFIVYFMIFFEDHSEVYQNAKMLFHEGKSELIDNILFTIYHARYELNKLTSIEKIRTSLNSCQVSRQITFDLYCLVVGAKKDMENTKEAELANSFKVAKPINTVHKITDIPSHMQFVDGSKIEDFIEVFKDEGLSLNSFKEDRLLKAWADRLREIVNEMKVTYFES